MLRKLFNGVLNQSSKMALPIEIIWSRGVVLELDGTVVIIPVASELLVNTPGRTRCAPTSSPDRLGSGNSVTGPRLHGGGLPNRYMGLRLHHRA